MGDREFRPTFTGGVKVERIDPSRSFFVVVGHRRYKES